jgi:hypothetical protein
MDELDHAVVERRRDAVRDGALRDAAVDHVDLGRPPLLEVLQHRRLRVAGDGPSCGERRVVAVDERARLDAVAPAQRDLLGPADGEALGPDRRRPPRPSGCARPRRNAGRTPPTAR